MARYQMAMSGELLALHEHGDLGPWPDGFRLTEVTDQQAGPFARWCWFEDDDAPEDLEGQRVEVTFRSEGYGADRVVTVLDRKLIG